MSGKVPLPQGIVLTREQKISGLTNIVNNLIYLQQSGVIIKDVDKFITKLRTKITRLKSMPPRERRNFPKRRKFPKRGYTPPAPPPTPQPDAGRRLQLAGKFVVPRRARGELPPSTPRGMWKAATAGVTPTRLQKPPSTPRGRSTQIERRSTQTQGQRRP